MSEGKNYMENVYILNVYILNHPPKTRTIFKHLFTSTDTSTHVYNSLSMRKLQQSKTTCLAAHKTRNNILLDKHSRTVFDVTKLFQLKNLIQNHTVTAWLHANEFASQSFCPGFSATVWKLREVSSIKVDKYSDKQLQGRT